MYVYTRKCTCAHVRMFTCTSTCESIETAFSSEGVHLEGGGWQGGDTQVTATLHTHIRPIVEYLHTVSTNVHVEHFMYNLHNTCIIIIPVVQYGYMYMYNYMYMNTQDTQKERKTKQHNTTQTLRQLFEKELHLRWDSNPRLAHSSRDALPTELPRQLSWLHSNHPYKSKQTKAKLGC